MISLLIYKLTHSLNSFPAKYSWQKITTTVTCLFFRPRWRLWSRASAATRTGLRSITAPATVSNYRARNNPFAFSTKSPPPVSDYLSQASSTTCSTTSTTKTIIIITITTIKTILTLNLSPPRDNKPLPRALPDPRPPRYCTRSENWSSEKPFSFSVTSDGN